MRRAILILGIARSGTSALAGALAAAGLPFGDHLKPADWQNPRGNHEDLPLSRLNQRVLARFGATWSTARPLPDGWLDHPETAVHGARILNEIESRFADVAAFGPKDPRLVPLFPLYRRLLEGAGWSVTTITIERPESQTLASIHKSGYFHGIYLPWRGRRLYRHYMSQIKALQQNSKNVHISHTELMAHPQAQLKALVGWLALDKVGLSLVAEDGARFIDPALWRNRDLGGAVKGRGKKPHEQKGWNG
jgi:hypothetical protein